MKKVDLFSIIFFVLFLNSISAQNYIDKDLCKKLKITSVKVYEYDYLNGVKIGERSLLFKWIYNSRGLISEKYFYDDDIGEIHYEYKYNEKDSLTEKISFFAGHPVSTFYEFEIDVLGKMTKKTEGNKVNFYIYDKNGNLIEDKWLYAGIKRPNVFFKDIYSYNSTSQVVKMIRRKSDESIFFSFNYLYDKVGNLIEQIRIENNDTTTIDKHSYDSNNNLIEDKTIDKKSGKIILWSKTTYDGNGLPLVSFGLLSGASKEYYREYIYEFE